MGLFASLNRGQKFDFELAEALPEENYRKLKDLEDGEVLILKSLYRNTKSKYGEHYTALAEGVKDKKIYGVNLPSFLNETIVGIIGHEAMVEQINKGLVGIQRSELLTSNNGKEYYTVVWVVLDEESDAAYDGFVNIPDGFDD